MKSCQRRITFVHDARRIDRHQLPEDCRVRWEGSRALEYVFERQIIVPCKCNSVFQGLYLPGYLLPPKLFDGRSSDHHRHILGVRQHSQDILDGAKIVDSDRHNGVVGGESGIFNATLVHCREHHGGAGKEILTVSLNKRRRRRADAHNQVGRLFAIEGTEIRDERRLQKFHH